MRSAQAVVEQLEELVSDPVVELSLGPACHPGSGFTLEFRRNGRIGCICAECHRVGLYLPMRTAELHDASSQAALSLLNAARILTVNGFTDLISGPLVESAHRVAAELERSQLPVVPGGRAADAAVHLQVLELVQKHGDAAVLEALAAVKGVARG